MKKQKTEKKWKLGDIATLLKNSFIAIVKGEFLMRLNLGKYFAHIVWTFFLFALLIIYSMMVDTTLGKVEANKESLQELKVLQTQKEYELIMLNRRSTVSRLLEEQGSLVAEPQEPATTLKK